MQDDMQRMKSIAARFAQVVHRVYARKWSFLGVFIFIFGVTVVTLGQNGLLPDVPIADAAPSPTVVLGTTPVSSAASQYPTRIEIPAIRLSATIANPTTTNVAALDALLLHGAVRYPTSAKLGETGNIVLFGHSSYLPVVYNPAYKTFDGIQTLAKGDRVIVYAASKSYTYRVRSVKKMNATTDGIPLAVSGKILTLATCNSFATKSDRFVVTADFAESHSISTVQ